MEKSMVPSRRRDFVCSDMSWQMMRISPFLCRLHGFGTAGYAAVGHVNGFYGRVFLKGAEDFL
ncbi:hypothetical protein LC724_31415 [Blautia sp. RD014234]|nr:hypothetical protein [Blautia parvula]